MEILSIPNVVVLEPVDVDVEAIRVHIHVGNEELYNIPSISLPIQTHIAMNRAVFYLGHQSPQAYYTN